MARKAFETVSDELLAFAQAAVTFFSDRGYTLSIEKHEMGFPSTPTILAKRGTTTMIIELQKTLDLSKLTTWVSYAKSYPKDFRVVICLPEAQVVPHDQADQLRRIGIGYYTATNTALRENIAPKDLALTVELPRLTELPRKLRAKLGSAYDHFDKSSWKEGFEDACGVLETEAKKYLIGGLTSGRIKFHKTGKQKPVIRQRISSASMGQLIGLFSRIQSTNQTDNIVRMALERVNQDRISVAHYRHRSGTDTKVRRYVGQHMWVIVEALRELYRVK